MNVQRPFALRDTPRSKCGLREQTYYGPKFIKQRKYKTLNNRLKGKLENINSDEWQVEVKINNNNKNVNHYIPIIVSSDMTPCSLVDRDGRFGETC